MQQAFIEQTQNEPKHSEQLRHRTTNI